MGAYLDEAWVRPPTVDDAPLHAVQFTSLSAPVQLVQTASRGAAAVLRVLSERDRALHAVPPHLRGGLVRQRLRVSERDIALMRRRLGVQLVQQFAQPLALQFRVA